MNKKHSTRIFNLAYVDEMTGLWNSNGFEYEALKQIEKNRGKNFAIAVVDVSKFSRINDNYGRETGDMVINAMAEVFKRNMTAKATVAHIKADHFIALIDYNNIKDLEMVISNIKLLVSSADFGIELRLKPSIGVCAVDVNSENFLSAIDNAQTAHSMAKSSETDVVYYDQKLKDYLKRQSNIADRALEALDKGEFEIYYQPKYDMRYKTISGAEALIRWNHSKMGFLSPDEFVPLLERTGDITEIDFYVLEETCKMVSKWLNKGMKPITVSVNQSRIHFQKSDYIDRLQNILIKYKIPRDVIELEITESLFDDENISEDIIMKMKMSGFLISVDDFGSGYSSLQLLNQVSVDVLKIDKSLLNDSQKGGKVKKIIRKIVEMAQDLGLEVICEGVEFEEQIEFLLSIGCNYAQGYFYSRPLKKEKFLELIEDKDDKEE